MAKGEFDLIVGLGTSGLAALRYLDSRSVSLRVMDSREQAPGAAEVKQQFPAVPCHTGSLRRDWAKRANRLIVSPGIALDEPVIAEAIDNGVEVIGDTELFARVADAPVVAITGSNAKSSVTTLMAEVVNRCGIKALAGGNLAPPALALLEQAAELYVLELSSFQLETLSSLKPAVATILNISEDHLDRHHTMAAYIAAKQRVYDGCCVAVWNRDQEVTRPAVSVDQEITFGVHSQADFRLDVQNNRLLVRGKDVMGTDELTLQGHHNALNALAVMAMADALELPAEQVHDTVKQFAGLPHRCRLVARHAGVGWFNDSKGTNVGATLAALNGIGAAIRGRIILLAGGQGKGQDFSPLATPAARFVRTAILFGEDAKAVSDGLGQQVEQKQVASFAEAVNLAAKLARAGDAVLLSPACASFDMFKNYQDRGTQFERLVREVTHA